MTAMHPNEKKKRDEAATDPRFTFTLTVREARVLLDWGLSEEAVAGWMDWYDEILRGRLARFVAAHSVPPNPEEPR